LAALRQAGEQPVDLVLRRAINEQRHRGREGEAMLHVAVDAHEILPMERKDGMHHGALLARTLWTITRDAGDARILEQRQIEGHGFLRLALEHQEGRDLLPHGRSPAVRMVAMVNADGAIL
jgi:hypothetical protein